MIDVLRWLMVAGFQPDSQPAEQRRALNLECGGMTPISTTLHVASFQSADVSAHSKVKSGCAEKSSNISRFQASIPVCEAF
jgi:hypothetical protein